MERFRAANALWSEGRTDGMESGREVDRRVGIRERYVGCADAEKLTSVTIIRNDGFRGARKSRRAVKTPIEICSVQHQSFRRRR